jgi:cell division protein FtsB
MVMTVVRIEITGGTQQHDAELRQIIGKSVKSTVSPSLSTRKRNKSTLPAKRRDVSNEILKRVERASFDALKHIPQVGSDRLDRTQQRRKRLDKLSPERRELYERIKKLRDEVSSVDFNIVDTLREMREST